MMWRPVTRRRVSEAALALLALAIVVPAAAANAPAPVSRTNIMRDPARGSANGELTTNVTYTGSTATAVASASDGIGLEQGLYYLLRTCIAYHLHGDTPLSGCAERNVDMRASTATVHTFAPSVTLQRQPRPTSQPWAYFTAYRRSAGLRRTVVGGECAQLAGGRTSGRRHRRRHARPRQRHAAAQLHGDA
jgi:hypothetical protein